MTRLTNMKRNKHIETLCHSCLEDYREVGFKVMKVKGQKYKDNCTHCQHRSGWDYEVRSKDEDRFK